MPQIDKPITEQIILDIIRNEMGLDEAQCVVMNQNLKIEPDNLLYVAAGVIGIKTLSARSNMVEVIPASPPGADPQQVEQNTVQQKETIQIDIFGRTNDALRRRWEITAALKSIHSAQQQEKYQIKIGVLPESFVDSSVAEGGSQMYRYSITFNCLVWYIKTKTLAPDGRLYYDDFHTRVDDANTIGTENGLIEFEIKGETIT